MNPIVTGKKLLIVEDEEDLRAPLATEFEGMGCIVYQASNGRDGFEIVKKVHPDAVISDIRMPGGDGVELLQRIKHLNYGVPVVMLITGFSDLSREEAYHLGADAILSKPFDLDAIDAAVIKILTPRDIRWQQPKDSTPVKKNIERHFEGLREALLSGDLAMGRGGFFVSQPHAQSGREEKLNFDIEFDTGEMKALKGQGTVRWARLNQEGHFPSGYGVEIESLSEGLRTQVITMTETLKLIPYIPKGLV